MFKVMNRIYGEIYESEDFGAICQKMIEIVSEKEKAVIERLSENEFEIKEVK